MEELRGPRTDGRLDDLLVFIQSLPALIPGSHRGDLEK
jgi:hypothetical protein